MGRLVWVLLCVITGIANIIFAVQGAYSDTPEPTVIGFNLAVGILILVAANSND